MKEDRPREAYDEIDLYEYLRVIWKWKWLIAIGVIVATLAAIPAAYLMRTYESQGVLRLSEALKPEELTQISKQGSKEIIVSLPEYKIYSAALTDSQAFLEYLNRHELLSREEMASVQGLKRKSVLDNIKPLYAYTENELKSLRPDEQLVSAIQLSWDGPSPELAQRLVDAMGLFVRDAIEQKIMEKYVNRGYQDAYSNVQEFERTLIDLRFSLKQKEQKFAELQKIAQRIPEGERLSGREVVSVEQGGYRYLPPSTQMVAVQVEVADTNLAIADTERQLKINRLRLEVFTRMKDLLQEKVAGNLFNHLEEIKGEFFQDKDVTNDEVLIVKNETSADFAQFKYRFHDVLQFISGPTLPQRAKPSKRLAVAVTFFLGLLFFMLLAFFLEFIERGQQRERQEVVTRGKRKMIKAGSGSKEKQG
jgi:LPS O-antigen subunit length determinant protein (WzzB/FepE family)